MAEKTGSYVQETPNGASESNAASPFDPFLHRVEMPFSALYNPVGFALQIATNSLEVLAAAQEIWERYEPRIAMNPIGLQVGVRAHTAKECPGMIISRAHQHLMTGIADAGNFYVADLMRSVSFAWVTTAVVRIHGTSATRFWSLSPFCTLPTGTRLRSTPRAWLMRDAESFYAASRVRGNLRWRSPARVRDGPT